MKNFRTIRLIIILSVMLLNVVNLKAQDKQRYQYKLSPLDSALRKATDTLLIFHFEENMMGRTPVVYLTKKDSLVNIFKYEFDAILKMSVPAEIRSLYATRLGKYYRYKYDRRLDEFFKILEISAAASQQLWKAIMELEPFGMQDDYDLGEGCDIELNGIRSVEIPSFYPYDAAYKMFTVFTKYEVKTFQFYAPEVFENGCAGRKGRQTIIAIEKLLSQYVNFN